MTWGALVLTVAIVAVMLVPTGLGHARAPGPTHPERSAIAPPRTATGATLGARMLATAARTLDRPAAGETPNATGAPTLGWADISAQSQSVPPERSYGRMMAWDPADHYVLLFGGDGAGGYMSDTWAFANGTWTQLSPHTSPSDRDHGTLVWDGADGYMLLFGGSGDSGTYNDTWKFLSGQWTQLHPASAPIGRWAAQMTYDASDGYVLLYGGCGGYALNDTWTYANDTWTELTPAVVPPPLQDANMVYDPAEGHVILFGGLMDWGTAVSNATWSFHNGGWSPVATPLSPSAREEGSMAYDPAAARVVLFGGTDLSGDILGDTWFYENGSWSPAAGFTSPPSRAFGELSNTSDSGYLVLFSGVGGGYAPLDDTWAFYSIATTAVANLSAGDAPFNVSFVGFTHGGLGESSVGWSFGDGTSAFGVSVDHLFTAPGIYTVTATSEDSQGLTSTASVLVHVAPTLELAASAAPTGGVAPLDVELGGTIFGGTAPYATTWTLDGAPVADRLVANLTLPAGSYAVELNVTDAVGRSVAWSTELGVRAAAPIPLYVATTGSPLIGDAPLAVTLTSQAFGGVGALAYDWTFGDGASSALADPSHTYTAAGDYPVELTLTDAAGVATTSTLAVAVYPSPSVLLLATSTGTAGLADTFATSIEGGLAPYVVLWEFGDGGSANGPTAQHTFSDAGTYTIRVNVTDALGGHATATAVVGITPATSAPEAPNTSSSGSADAGTWAVVGAEVGLGILAAAVVLVIARRRRP